MELDPVSNLSIKPAVSYGDHMHKHVNEMAVFIAFGYLFFPADNINGKHRPTISESHELHQQQS